MNLKQLKNGTHVEEGREEIDSQSRRHGGDQSTNGGFEECRDDLTRRLVL